MLLSCIGLNKEQTIQSYYLVGSIELSIDFVAVFKKGPILGEFTLILAEINYINLKNPLPYSKYYICPQKVTLFVCLIALAVTLGVLHGRRSPEIQ